ncbi:MAG: carbohydrate binding domain-containing protein [Patescibacteria group bacterium]|nr:carbohydrate binding domain-containing protein [Patescibacteria group bacterium]
MKKHLRKIIISFLLGVMIFSLLTPLLFWPKPAYAQGASTTVGDIPRVLEWIKSQAIRIYDKVKYQVIAILYKSFLEGFAQKFVTESATWLATGGKAGKPMFFTDKEYWNKMADSVVGDLLDEVATKGFGLQSLCDPIDPTIKLNILLFVKPPKIPFEYEARCPISKMKERIREAKEKLIAQYKEGLKGYVNVEYVPGQPPQVQVKIKNAIRIDTKLYDVNKSNLINIADQLSGHQQLFLTEWDKYLQESKKIGPPNISGVLNSLSTIKERLKAITQGPPTFQTSLNWWLGRKWTSDGYRPIEAPVRCLNKSQEEFCQNPNCYNGACPGINNATQCQNNYSYCFEAIKRAQNYASQLSEWATTLEKMVDEAREAVEKGTPSPDLNILEDIQKTFTPEGSDLGVAMSLKSGILSKAAEKVGADKFFQSLQGQFQSVTSKISGKALLPAGLTEERARQMIAEGKASLKVYTGVLVADVANTFIQTFFSKFLERLFQKEGLNPEASPSGRTSWEGGIPASPTQEKIEAIYADLKTVSFKKPSGEINLLEEFAACPTETKYALPYNCVIDGGFARAIEENLTIKEAIEKNYLHGNWYVGSYGLTDGARDFSSRYSLTNLKKLRRARVIPLGLEIAAEKISRGDFGDAKFTLAQIVEGFDKVSSDGDCTIYVQGDPKSNTTEKKCEGSIGSWDSSANCCKKDGQCLVSASPFCHLVDPNWVLKLPSMQCNLMAYSAIPLPASNERQETCIEMKDCVGENEDGTCHTYGYCTREKNIWRLAGTQCPAYYNTCQLYTRTKDNQRFAWLKNTLDFGDCDANSVGCQWYCQRWNKDFAEGAGGWICTEPNQSLNIQPNGSVGSPRSVSDPFNTIFFNKFVETCPATSEGCSEFIRTKENLGTNLLPNSSFEDYSETSTTTTPTILVKGWQITSGQFLVDEAEAKSGKVSAKFTGSGKVELASTDNVDISLLPGTKYTLSFWVKNKDQSNDREIQVKINNSVTKIIPISKNTPWQRVSTDFIAPNNKKIIDLEIAVNGTGIYLDDLQLEVGSLSSYKSYASTNKIYLKKAPDWMKCYNRDNNGNLITNDDDHACADYALACQQDEVGCEKYTPVLGGPYLPAVARDTDRCPRECVGYEVFKQKPTHFYSEEDAYFIPRTVRICPASEVGCEEFTNLDVVNRGGEGREYYSYLRPCQKPRAECQYFYTWIGSETTGYQLKRYYLLAKTTTNGFEPDEMLSSNNAQALWGRCQNSQDARTNPHCKEFYDANGHVSYKLYKNTITCSETCVPLRKTTTVISGYCPTSTQGGLALNGVEFNNGICTYMAIPAEGERCSSVNVGCREYQGNAANNLRILFEDDFESLTVEPWIDGELSSESIYFGGRSMRVANNNNSVSRPVQDLVQKGRSYLLSFWVKRASNNSTTLTIRFRGNDNNIDFPSLPALTTGEWYSFTVGPVYFQREVANDERLVILSSSPFYLDNITLKEVRQNIFAIKNSWQTPTVCDQDLTGASAPGYHLGCAEYRDRANQSHFFRSFSKLCPEIKIGCEALIETKNSTSPFSETFNLTDPDEPKDNVLVPADQLTYLVVDQTKACPAGDKGCQKFGLPNLSQGEPISWTDFYLKNNPDLYTRRPILCRYHQQNCEEFEQAAAGKVYFKDPGEKICVWREKVPIGSEYRTGWFKKGTDQPCYTNYLPDGVTYGIKFSEESGYQGLVGECEERFAGCTEYIEPLRTAGVTNYVQNGDFEIGSGSSGQGPAPNWSYGYSGNSSTVSWDGASKSLKIANDTPHTVGADTRKIYAASQIVEIPHKNQKSFVLNFKVKVVSTSHLSYPSGHVNLKYEGWRGVTQLNGCQTEECQDWQEYKNHCGSSQSCCSWVGGNWSNNQCNISGQPKCKFNRGNLKECIAFLIKNGGNPWGDNLNHWPWNYEHGYEIGASIDASTTITSWQKRSLRVVAGGPLNPKNLAIEEIKIIPLLAPAYWHGGCSKTNAGDCTTIQNCPNCPWRCCEAFGEVYFDDIEFKPLDPYYYLDNNQLDKASCRGQVSLKEGCVLFKAQNDPSAIYNSIATYAKSEANQHRLVSPIDCTKKPWPVDGQGNPVNSDDNCTNSNFANTDYCRYCYALGQNTNDTNLILKVRRDRVCGEWLYCAGKRYVWQENQQRFLEICDYFLRCQKQTGEGSGAQCTLVSTETPEVLTEQKYKNRDFGWTGMDYSGYSLYNFYPVEMLRPKNYPNGYALSYLSGTTDYGVGNRTCTRNEDCPKGQVCYQSKCVVSPTCKLYPENTSPFSREVEGTYRGLNLCTERGGNNCLCSYRKAESVLGEPTYYFNLETDVESIKVCTQAENPQDLGKCCSPPCPNGMAVAFREDCTRTDEGRKNNQGKCEPMKKITDYIGLAGYCLEPDLEKPKEIQACLTWFPGEVETGLDSYNQVRSAGYFPSSDRRWYGYERYTRPAEISGFAPTFFPLGFNLTSSFPGQRLGGNWGCFADRLIQPLYLGGDYGNKCSEYTNYGETDLGYCFLAEGGEGTILQAKYIPYLERKIKREEIQKIIVKAKFRWENTTCSDLNTVDCSSSNKCCGPFDLELGPNNFKRAAYLHATHQNSSGYVCKSNGTCPVGGACLADECPDKNKSCLFIQAEFDQENYLRNFHLEFNEDGSGWGGAIIYTINLHLKSGANLPIKAYLAPASEINVAEGASCWRKDSNNNSRGCCQDYLGFSSEELKRDGSVTRQWACDGTDKEMASCFRGDQRKGSPSQAIYLYSSSYFAKSGNNFYYLDRKIYEYMIDRIEIDWKIDKSNPGDCKFGADYQGTIILPYEDPATKEKKYEKEVTGKGNGEARLFVQTIFDQKEGELKGFKVEFNDDDAGHGAAALTGIRIILKEAANKLVKINDKPYLPTVVNTNLVKLKPGTDVPYGNLTDILDYSYECLPRGATGFQGTMPKKYIIDSKGEVCHLYSGGIYDSDAVIKKLFPKSYAWSYLDVNTLSYLPGNIANNWDSRSDTSLHPTDRSPQIQSVNFSTGVPAGGTVGKITIGNQESGNILISGKTYTATLRFYAWADGAYMPVREVVVDWGDGFRSGSSNMITKNRKPVCKKGTDGLPLSFGDDPDACLNQYWEFVHTYLCTNPNGCSYQPKVYVKDNWGWCAHSASTPTTPYAGDFSCLDPDGNPGTSTPANFGVPYDGQIILNP